MENSNKYEEDLSYIDPETLKKMWDLCLPKLDNTLGLGKIILISTSENNNIKDYE